MSEPGKKGENDLNKNAKEYVPTKNRVPEKLNLNLDADEYKPKPVVEYVEAENDDDDEQVQEQMDMIVKDMVEQDIMNELKEDLEDDDSEDEDKWLPKYKDCECCHGFVYKCKGSTCKALGECYCKMKDDCENIEEEKPKENNANTNENKK